MEIPKANALDVLINTYEDKIAKNLAHGISIQDDSSTSTSEDDIELNDYKKNIKLLATAESDLVFNNSSPKHAAIVLTEMVCSAKNEFRIYDDDLSGDITSKHPGFFPAIKSFLNRIENSKLKIVIDSSYKSTNDEFNTCEIFQKLQENYSGRVKIWIASNQFKESVSKISSNQVILNFAVGDQKSFRIEETEVDGNQNKPSLKSRKAICSFNNHQIASKLAEIFDENLDTCDLMFPL